MAAAPTRPVRPGRCPPILRASRARCRSTIPARASGRMLALDLDPARGDVEHEARRARPAARAPRRPGTSPTSRRAAAATSTSCSPRRCRGASCATSPGPWRCASPRSTRRRCPALGGQISPPGARHKSGGWRVLSTPLSEAMAAVEHPNGPEVWAALLDELAAELQAGRNRHGECTDHGDCSAELDDTGVPWVPRLGGRASARL